MNAVASRLPGSIGGSADLNPSTHTALSGLGDFEPAGMNAPDKQGAADGVWGYAGRNLYFGVREHGMGAILNGLAAHGGTVPFGATSVDVTKHGIDKAYGVRKLRDVLHIAIDKMIFVGDAVFPGGNDYPAKEAGAQSIEVRDPHETKRVIEAIIACQEES